MAATLREYGVENCGRVELRSRARWVILGVRCQVSGARCQVSGLTMDDLQLLKAEC